MSEVEFYPVPTTAVHAVAAPGSMTLPSPSGGETIDFDAISPEVAQQRAIAMLPDGVRPPAGYSLVGEAHATDCLPPPRLTEHVRANTLLIDDWEMRPFAAFRPVLVVGGGPSASDHVDDIRAKQRRGAEVIAVNGSHDWLVYSHGIVPDIHVVLDPMECAADWVQRPHPDVLYMIGSIANPAVTTALAGYRRKGFHAITSSVMEWLESEEAKQRRGNWYAIGGASTAALRMMNLVWVGGGRWIEFYGVDSSFRGARHHAYDQPIPPGCDRYNPLKLWANGKSFVGDSGMLIQAMDFRALLLQFWPQMVIVVHGDGLLPHVYNTWREAAWQNFIPRLTSPTS